MRRECHEAQARSDREYEETTAAMAAKKALTGEEEAELWSDTRCRVLGNWARRRVPLQPDRFAHEPDKLETYGKLTAAINHAKDTGDLDALREIAGDPEAFIRKQGWASVELADEKEIAALRRLLEMLQIKIVEVIEATNQLKESPDYELYDLAQRDASILDTVGEKQKQQIEAECSKLSEEADELAKQVEELTGESAF